MTLNDQKGPLDLVRQITLVQAVLNADGSDPRATRLDNRVTATNAIGDAVVLELDGDRLLLWMDKPGSEQLNVTNRTVPEIVDLIEGLIAGKHSE